MTLTRAQDYLEALYSNQKNFDAQDVELLFESLHLDFNLLPLKSNLVREAFTHSSFAHEYNLTDQERLEFLGDSVLQILISHNLFEYFPNLKEGELTRLRRTIVNEKALSLLAQKLKLDAWLLVGRGEYFSHATKRESILANTLESFLGLIYLSYDLKYLQEVWGEWMKKYDFLPLLDSISKTIEAKSYLQEETMKRWKSLPVYESEEIRLDNKLFFRMSLIVNGEKLLTLDHPSKKEAQRMLAKQCLENNLLDKVRTNYA